MKCDNSFYETCMNILEENCRGIMSNRKGVYGQDDDALHNFRLGSDITGNTMAQTAFGYMAKHMASLRDMIDQNDFSNVSNFTEKCTDIINYIKIIYVIGMAEEHSKSIECMEAQLEEVEHDD